MKTSQMEYEHVSSFILRFSSAISLQEINWDKIYSFRVADDPERHLAFKRRLCEQVKLNMALIERDMGRDDKLYTNREVSLVRSLYLQHRNAKSIVEDHIKLIEQIIEWRERQVAMLDEVLADASEESYDNLPF